MDEESAFLRKLLEQPSNDLTRLVYADWLDEQGTPEATAKAEFLRLIADAELIGKLTDRAMELARELPTNWLAIVSKLPVENCWAARPLRFDYVCSKRWEELATTEQTGERFCGECQKTVYYCGTIREAKVHAVASHCVAVDLAIPRQPGDVQAALVFMGQPSREDYLEVIRAQPNDPVSEARERAAGLPRRSWWSRLWRRG